MAKTSSLYLRSQRNRTGEQLSKSKTQKSKLWSLWIWMEMCEGGNFQKAAYSSTVHGVAITILILLYHYTFPHFHSFIAIIPSNVQSPNRFLYSHHFIVYTTPFHTQAPPTNSKPNIHPSTNHRHRIPSLFQSNDPNSST